MADSPLEDRFLEIAEQLRNQFIRQQEEAGKNADPESPEFQKQFLKHLNQYPPQEALTLLQDILDKHYSDFVMRERKLGQSFTIPVKAARFSRYLQEQSPSFSDYVTPDICENYITEINRNWAKYKIECREDLAKYERLLIGLMEYRDFHRKYQVQASQDAEAEAFFEYVKTSPPEGLERLTYKEARYLVKVAQEQKQTLRLAAAVSLAGLAGLTQALLSPDLPPETKSPLPAEAQKAEGGDAELGWRQKLLKDAEPDDKDLSNPSR